MIYRYQILISSDDYIYLFDRLENRLIFHSIGFLTFYHYLIEHNIQFNDIYFKKLSLQKFFDKFVDEKSLQFEYIDNYRHYKNKDLL